MGEAAHHAPGGDTSCSIARTLEIIGDRWTLLILRDAFRGIRRFDEYRRDAGGFVRAETESSLRRWDIPIRIGAGLVLAAVLYILFSNTYRKVERLIIGFVSLIGLSFLFELSHVSVNWSEAAVGWVAPSFPHGAIPLIMSVLGAVVMPHNLFLHSEVIQSRQWQLEKPEIIERQLKYEFIDTLFSMVVGWAINSSMILVSAAVFFRNGVEVTELQQAEQMLRPLLGHAAAVVFAVALLLAGLASSVTAGMAGGSILAGMFDEPYSIKDVPTRAGVWFTLVGAFVAILFVANPFQWLLVSQMLLSVQLPITIFLQIRLTSSAAVMGRFRNSRTDSALLWATGLVVSGLNVLLLWSLVTGAG